MKIKILVAVLVFLIVLNLVVLGHYIYYQILEPSRLTYRPHAEMMRMPQTRLHLDKEQRKRMLELRRKFQAESEPLRLEIIRLRGEIAEQLTAERVDWEKIDRNLQEIGRLQAEIEKKALHMLLNTRQFLKPDQIGIIYRWMTSSMRHHHPQGRPRAPRPAKDSTKENNPKPY